MLYSLAIPVYNTPSHALERCLESVVRELNGRDAECVIVDDGSTDGSREIIKRFAESYPKLFKCHRQENKGNCVSRNEAIRRTTGEWVGFLDSDDFLTPGFFTYVEMSIKQWGNKYPVMHYNHYRCHITDDDVLQKSYIPSDRMTIKAHEVTWEKRNRSHTLMWTMLIKKAFIEENNLYLPEDKVYEISNKAHVYVGQDNYYKVLLFNYAPNNVIFDMCWFGVCHYIRKNSLGSHREEAPSTWEKDVKDELLRRKELYLPL